MCYYLLCGAIEWMSTLEPMKELSAGWCAYSDITMAIQQVREASGGAVDTVWIIDTDAHQVRMQT